MATNVVNSANRPLLTIPEVAAMLGISRERCYQMAAEGRIPCVRLSPRRIRVPRAALDAWLAEQAERALGAPKTTSRPTNRLASQLPPRTAAEMAQRRASRGRCRDPFATRRRDRLPGYWRLAWLRVRWREWREGL